MRRLPATSSSPFLRPGQGLGRQGDWRRGVNALAAKGLDKDKMTHGQRLGKARARMRGGSVPRGDRGGHRDKQRRGSGESIGGDGDDDDDFRDRRRADSRYTIDNSDDPTHDPTPSGDAIAQQRALPVVSARRRARRVGVRGGRSTRRRVRDSISSLTARGSSICGPVVESEDFELLVVIVILVNCVSLALYRPTEGTGSAWNTRLDRLELGLNGFFTLELVLRISHRGARECFRDPWNGFDFALVLAGVLRSAHRRATGRGGQRRRRQQAEGAQGSQGAEAARTITRFQSLRSVVVCFIEAVPLLVSVVGFVVFFTFLFAIAGHQLFQEAYHQRCEDPSTGVPETWNDAFGCDSIDKPQITGYNPAGSERGSGRTCPPFDELGNPLECVYVHSGRGNSVAGYDNVAAGMLTVFQCTTLAGWARVMYRIMDSGSEVAVPYFVLLVFFGPYFVVNLFLAVLKTKFGRLSLCSSPR